MFNAKTALFAARTCAADYLGDAGIAALGVVPDSIRSLATESDYVVAAKTFDGPTLLSFRGTAERTGWLSNLQALPLPWGDMAGSVHRGFARAFYGDLAQWVKIHVPDNYPVQIHGHSRGGPLAIHAGRYLKACGYTVESIYTFGCPNFCDGIFADAYAELPCVQVVHEADPVPWFPRGLGYVPFRKQIRLYDDGSILESPGRLRRLWDAWRHWGVSLEAFAVEIITEHEIDTYVAALELAAAGKVAA